MALPEPWLRGPLPGVSPLVANLFYSFTQAREEIAATTDGLATGELWVCPHGLGSVGFHIRHSGGATERLGAYLMGRTLTAAQLEDLRHEQDAGANIGELMSQLAARQATVESYVRTLELAGLAESRAVGRAGLPSTAIGLIVHIAEHTQRHLGQAVTLAKLVKALRA